MDYINICNHPRSRIIYLYSDFFSLNKEYVLKTDEHSMTFREAMISDRKVIKCRKPSGRNGLVINVAMELPLGKF